MNEELKTCVTIYYY